MKLVGFLLDDMFDRGEWSVVLHSQPRLEACRACRSVLRNTASASHTTSLPPPFEDPEKGSTLVNSIPAGLRHQCFMAE